MAAAVQTVISGASAGVSTVLLYFMSISPDVPAIAALPFWYEQLPFQTSAISLLPTLQVLLRGLASGLCAVSGDGERGRVLSEAPSAPAAAAEEFMAGGGGGLRCAADPALRPLPAGPRRGHS